MGEPIELLAALAGTNTAARWLSIDGDGAAKLVFEIPATELGQAMKLALMLKKTLVLLVTEDS